MVEHPIADREANVMIAGTGLVSLPDFTQHPWFTFSRQFDQVVICDRLGSAAENTLQRNLQIGANAKIDADTEEKKRYRQKPDIPRCCACTQRKPILAQWFHDHAAFSERIMYPVPRTVRINLASVPSSILLRRWRT